MPYIQQILVCSIFPSGNGSWRLCIQLVLLMVNLNPDITSIQLFKVNLNKNLIYNLRPVVLSIPKGISAKGC